MKTHSIHTFSQTNFFRITIIAMIVMFGASILHLQTVHAGDPVTHIEPSNKNPILQTAVIGGNLQVSLKKFSNGWQWLHGQEAIALHKLKIEAPAKKGKGAPKATYSSILYDTATVETTNAVTTRVFFPDKNGPGLFYFVTEKTTDYHVRKPIYETIPYEIIVHLKNVRGKLQNGNIVPFGDVDAHFNDTFEFHHLDSENPLHHGLSGCLELVCLPKVTVAENVEGPTPTLAGDDENEDNEVPTLVIPAGDNKFGVQPFEFPVDLPQDFFGPGSEPFTGVVVLGGANMDTPDTTVQRLAPIELEGDLPRNDTVPIEMVQLELVGIQPITVTFNDGTEQKWNVQINLSDGLPSLGQTTITESFDGGGTFNSFFDVQIEIIFTPGGDEPMLDLPTDPIQSDPNFEVKLPSGDGTLIGEPTQYLVGEKVELKVELTDVPWTVCPGTESDFCPETQNVEFALDFPSEIEEIEQEVDTKLTAWTEQRGGTSQAFDWADENGDGRLDQDEVTRMLKDAGVEVPWWIPWHTVSRHLIEKNDTNNDEELDLDEFKTMLQ